MCFFNDIFKCTDSLLFTTEFVPTTPHVPPNWWYYGVDHGQHISFFTEKSLRHITGVFSKHLYTSCGNLDLITSRPVRDIVFRLATNQTFCKWFYLLNNRPSLLESDWKNILNKSFGEFRS